MDSKKPPRIRSTLAFRIINPELFIKPNKFIMGFGLLCFGGCALYLFNMNMKDDGRKVRFSVETGKVVERSKWD
eukprot:gene15723-7018_t